MEENYLESVTQQFEFYKMLGEKTFDQIKEEDIFWQYNSESNSIAVIVKHLRGNMMSRWTDFLTTDGEKDWRNRDAEFEPDIRSKEELLAKWNEGWNCLFEAINSINRENLGTIIYIRNMGHTIVEVNKSTISTLFISRWTDCIYRTNDKRRRMEEFIDTKRKIYEIQQRKIL